MDRDLTLYNLLALLTEQDTGFRYEDGEYRAYCEEISHGHTARFEIRLTEQGEMHYLLDWEPVSREQFMASALRLPEERLRAMEVALRFVRERHDEDLLHLLHQGWRFPDDGRASFSWVRYYPGETKVAGVLYLDGKGHLAYELDGRPATREELIEWVGRPAEEFAAVEGILLRLADEA